MLTDKKSNEAPKKRAVLFTELDQDISYSMWRRGAEDRAGEPMRPMGALLR